MSTATKTATTATATATAMDNVSKIIDALPSIVRPHHLMMAYGMVDGGKTIRRHLRAKYAETCKHGHGDVWQWQKNDAVLREIVEYLDGKFGTKK
jgi:hypothetical protein